MVLDTIAWSTFGMYFLSCKIWNTLCMRLSYIGISGWQAMRFNLLVKLYGLIDLSINLFHSLTSLYFSSRNFLKNLIIYLKLQRSPSSISISFLSVPIVCFQESFDVCHLLECWRKSSWPKRWFCRRCLRHFTLMFHVNFSASIFTTSTIGRSMLSSNANVGHRSRSTTCSNLKELDPLIFLDAYPYVILKLFKRFNWVIPTVLRYVFLIKASATTFVFPGLDLQVIIF